MRTSLSQQIRNALSYMNTSSVKLTDAQERATTGKRILRPSDDVPGTNQAMSLRSAINTTEQLTNNIEVSKPLLNSTMSAMDDLVQLVQKVQIEATGAANSELVDGSNDARVANLRAYLSQMKDIANSKHLDQYIFSGTATDKPAVVEQAGPPSFVYNGTMGTKQTQVLSWVTMPVGIPGSKVFNFDGSAGPGTTDLFTMVSTLIDKIQSGSPTDVSTQLDNIQENLGNLLTCSAQVGSWSARIDQAKNTLEDTSTRLAQMLSDVEDVDLPSAVIDLKTQENVYQAALSVSGQILNLSLASSQYLLK
jgi:flagellar hook-associated protein 3 FlgL